MTDQEVTINVGKLVFDDNNKERKSWACLGQICSRSLIVFLSQLFVILLIIFGCFGHFNFQNFVLNPLFVLHISAVRQDTIYPHQDFERVNFYKKPSL